MMGRAYVLLLSPAPGHGSKSGRNRLVCMEVVMLYVAFGVLMLLVLAGAGLYVKYDQSRAVISTSEWVRLMRKNNIRYDRGTRTKANKSRPS